MRAPLDSPVMAGFVSQLQAVNTLAEQSPGFVWRLQTPEGDATAVRAFDDQRILLNITVWESVEALKNFTYGGSHLAAYRDRAKWFEPPTEAYLALWWIPAGHLPDVQEAIDRLQYRREHGDTPEAFSFAKPYPPPEAPSANPVAPTVVPPESH